MKRLLCRLIGHDRPFPLPTGGDIARWVKGLPPLSPLEAPCRRCGVALAAHDAMTKEQP